MPYYVCANNFRRECRRRTRKSKTRRTGRETSSQARAASSTTGGKSMTNKLCLYGGAIATAGLAALAAAPAQAAEAKKVCYAFQDLSTGFWVAGHKAIVT